MNKNEKAYMQRLDEVALGNLDKAAFKALLRLQVYFTGRTHELILKFGADASVVLLRYADEEGVLDGSRGFRAQSELLNLWGDTWKIWQDEFLAARREAVSLPFGSMAVRHERLMRAAEGGRQNERREIASQSATAMKEAIEDGVFKPQVEILLNAAGEHIYGDGMNLSGRIWRVDREAREAINNAIMQGVANGDSAWNIAKTLEQYLGAGKDCPRWTSTRLYGRTASDRAAGDTGGLLSGNDCDGRGVSYNALRLARTEIQKAHALATDKLLAQQPWVEKEKCNLSAAHPEPDECDDAANGGENGDGVYPVGTIEFPLHPHCFCFKTAVMMDSADFTKKLNGWLNGESWSEMDEYQQFIGGDVAVSLLPQAFTLAIWLFGEELGL